MKKLVVVAAVAIVALSSACKKDYVCECNGGGFTAKLTTVYHDTKKNVDKTCKNIGSSCTAVAK